MSYIPDHVLVDKLVKELRRKDVNFKKVNKIAKAAPKLSGEEINILTDAVSNKMATIKNQCTHDNIMSMKNILHECCGVSQ